MGHNQTCAWCKEPVHYREDLDTDEKTVCNSCFAAICRDMEKGKDFVNSRETIAHLEGRSQRAA